MKHQFLTAFFSAFLCAIASTAADAQSLSNKSAFELSAGIGHSTSSQYLDTASAGAGLRFGALLGENIRLIAGVSRNFDRLTERRDLQNGDDRGTSFSLAAAWDIASAHEVSLGYFYSRYEYNFVGMPAQLAVQENEILSLNYSYFADWGQAGAGVSELLGDSSSTIFRVNGEYKLPNMGGETELFATGSAFGSSSDSAKGFAVGLRAKMDRGYNLYAMAGRSYLSSGGHGTTFNLSLVKSFGSNAERVFRRN